MKKIILGSILATALLSIQAFAEDSNIYVGLDIGNTSATLTATVDSNSFTEEDNGGSQTLKVGTYLDSNSRAYGYLQNINIDDGTGYSLGVGYDYLFGENDFKPFVGALIGYGSISDDEDFMDITGLVYGVQAGIYYNINDCFLLGPSFR